MSISRMHRSNIKVRYIALYLDGYTEGITRLDIEGQYLGCTEEISM